MYVRRLLVAVSAALVVTPAAPARAAAILALASPSYFYNCGWDCATAEATHSTWVPLVEPSLGGTGFLYWDGVLVDTCQFGPLESCNTSYGPVTWAWDNDGVGCHTELAVTILVGGDTDVREFQTPQC